MISSFGTFIKRQRQRQELSQTEVAKLVNVGRVVISHWENGKYLPSMEHILKLTKVLNCDYQFIMELIIHDMEVKENENYITSH